MLMLITLTFTGLAYSDGYADVGYKDGLSMQVNMKVYAPFYLRAELGTDVSSYGVGAAWNNSYFNVMGTVDFINGDFEYGLQAYYYDKQLSYFGGVNYNNGALKMGYRLGIGDALNSNVSLITYYSDKGGFFGFRKWFK